MAADEFLEQIVAAAFSAIDLPAAREVLKELDLPPRYSEDAIATINAATNVLADQAAELKRNEAPRVERKAVRVKVDRLVNARAFLYQLRAIQPGDVTVVPAPVGGNN